MADFEFSLRLENAKMVEAEELLRHIVVTVEALYPDSTIGGGFWLDNSEESNEQEEA